ncbi:hypothetical protein CYMTET_19078 [Cymbomonas tetramitiformis]|uniref:Uncharacterized protein n=1 Tax=Cymbomonas tetramitiformis TaxID=36881 RepID=A0AAE0G6T9_9CHLO|nr:hypothetical protein CYMTET_19078 [Cymbomonas tetramitiformis]
MCEWEEEVMEAIWEAERQAPDRVDRQIWSVSVTEREVVAGLQHNSQHVQSNGMCIFRTLEGLNEALDRDPGNELLRQYGTSHDADFDMLQADTSFGALALVGFAAADRLRATLTPNDLREYTVPWSSKARGICKEEHRNFLAELCGNFLQDTKARIQAARRRRRTLTMVELECVQQHEAAHAKSEKFYGRCELQEELRRRVLAGAGGCPVLVHGDSGSGKTSLLCRVAVTLQQQLPESGTMVLRLCGTTPLSSSARELLWGVCMQLSMVRDEATGPPISVPAISDFMGLVEWFAAAMATATEDAPIVVVLDSLDQLSDLDNGRSQPHRWLPMRDLNPHAHLVLSSLSSEHGIVDTLRSVLPQSEEAVAHIMQVPLLQGEEGELILRDWLDGDGRGLSEAQWAAVRAAIPPACTILYIRLLFDRVKQWHSYDAAARLPDNVPDLIDRFYHDLEREHGTALVNACLRLLLVARSGLSTEALIDLLSADDDVLGGPGQPGTVLEKLEPPMRRLPPLVFARLRAALGDYVVERGANGIAVLALYHRQFLEVGRQRYRLNDPAVLQHTSHALASLFSGDLARSLTTRGIKTHPLWHGAEPNRRRVHELPGALIQADEVGRCATECLCNLEFLEAAFAAGEEYVSDLLDTYFRVLSDDAASVDSAAVTQFRIFVSRWRSALLQRPKATLSLAGNEPESSPVAMAAARTRARVAAGASTGGPLYLKWCNKPQTMEPCVSTVAGPSRATHNQDGGRVVSACAFGAEGKRYAVGTLGRCVVYDTLSGRMLSCFTEHQRHGGEQPGGWVYACCFKPEVGEEVLSGGEDCRGRVWGATDGTQRLELRGHRGRVLAVAWEGETLITGSADGTVRLWSSKDGAVRRSLQEGAAAVTRVAVLRHQERLLVAAGTYRGGVFVSRGERLATRYTSAGDHAVTGLEWVPASAEQGMKAPPRLLAVNFDGSATLLSARCEPLMTWRVGHARGVTGCALSPQGASRFVTAGSDGLLLLHSWGGDLNGKPEPNGQLTGHAAMILGTAWSSNGDILLSCCEDGTSKLWSPQLAGPVHGSGAEGDDDDALLDIASSGGYLGFYLSPDGSRLQVLRRDGYFARYDLDPAEYTAVPEHPANLGCYPDDIGDVGCYMGGPSLDSPVWAVAHYSTQVAVWDAGFPEASVRWTPEFDDDIAYSSGSGDGTEKLALGGHGRAGPIVWLEGNAEDCIEMTSHFNAWVYDVQWSPTGQWLLSTGSDGSHVHAADDLEGEPVARMPHATHGAWSNDSRWVALHSTDGQGGYCSGGEEVSVFEARTGTHLARLPCQFDGGPVRLAWSPDDTVLFALCTKEGFLGVPCLFAFAVNHTTRPLNFVEMGWFMLPSSIAPQHLKVASEPRGPPYRLVVATASGELHLVHMGNFSQIGTPGRNPKSKGERAEH